MFPDLLRDDVFRLETRRLWLRWPRAADAATIARLAGDREVAEMTSRIPHPYPPGSAAEFVLMSRAANHEGRSLTLVLSPKARPNEALGCIDLAAVGPDELRLGYWLGRPFWSQGLMSEAAIALIDIAPRAGEVRLRLARRRRHSRAGAGRRHERRAVLADARLRTLGGNVGQRRQEVRINRPRLDQSSPNTSAME
jgi:RimJ/RimL family protein N-acetyltransferase